MLSDNADLNGRIIMYSENKITLEQLSEYLMYAIDYGKISKKSFTKLLNHYCPEIAREHERLERAKIRRSRPEDVEGLMLSGNPWVDQSIGAYHNGVITVHQLCIDIQEDVDKAEISKEMGKKLLDYYSPNIGE